MTIQHTARLGLPYPQQTDSADVVRDIAALAAASDGLIPYGQGTHSARPNAGSTPQGFLYRETDTGGLFWNDGTVWQPINTQIPLSALATAVQAALFSPGDVKPTSNPVTAGSEPTGWLLGDGRSVLRTDYPDLTTVYAAASFPYGTADGTHMNLPDYRGRELVGVGTHADINAVAKNEGNAVANRRPKHRHSLGDAYAIASGAHSHGGITAAESAAHSHTPGSGGGGPFMVFNAGGPYMLTVGGGMTTSTTTSAESAFHQHNISTDGNHQHFLGGTIGVLDASGTVESAPYQTVHYLIKT